MLFFSLWAAGKVVGEKYRNKQSVFEIYSQC